MTDTTTHTHFSVECWKRHPATRDVIAGKLADTTILSQLVTLTASSVILDVPLPTLSMFASDVAPESTWGVWLDGFLTATSTTVTLSGQIAARMARADIVVDSIAHPDTWNTVINTNMNITDPDVDTTTYEFNSFTWPSQLYSSTDDCTCWISPQMMAAWQALPLRTNQERRDARLVGSLCADMYWHNQLLPKHLVS